MKSLILPKFLLMDKKQLEKYSSAFTLSDMEIFIFPELYYSLVLANIMSPAIWEWRKDPWFKQIEKKSFSYKINRIKQYIMDHYTFNLDLDTWGLTTKKQEINRFKDFVDMDILTHSNALFGYEGDKYYFSIDIRKHFGLDKYQDEDIPYWKTETVEAMDAFRYKQGYSGGAGECVSLATLYAAALFIVGKIPLEKIFLLATPLHSQNFIDEKDGIITNNRRIVTKSMWYNGTLLTAKARRAIENEKITMVSHISGHIHTVFPETTMPKAIYKHFSDRFSTYLKGELTFETFVCFLRSESKYWDCFQYAHKRHDKLQYIELRTIFEYEHTSKNALTNSGREALLEEIESAEFHLTPRQDKLVINEYEDYLLTHPHASFPEKKQYFEEVLMKNKTCPHIKELFEGLLGFLEITPQLPVVEGKQFVPYTPLQITSEMERNDVMNEVLAKAGENENARLALYAYRMMDKIDWQPFLKAVFERNPIAVNACKEMHVDQVYAFLQSMENISIYPDVNRLALPDEVWNFQRGDGLEKALLFASILKDKMPDVSLHLLVENGKAMLNNYVFETNKLLTFNAKL